MHSEICPVCGGSGNVKLDGTKWSEGKDQVKTCHGCNGRGWVEVRDSYILCEPPAPIVPYLDPYPFRKWKYEYDGTAAEDNLWRDRVWT